MAALQEDSGVMMTRSSFMNVRRTRMSTLILAGAVCLISPTRAGADDPPGADELSLASPISGTLYIAGGGRLPEKVYDDFVERAGGTNAHIAVVTSASETADS